MKNSTPSLRGVRFGEFEADLKTGDVRKQGHRIKLQEKPFQILALLLERAGDLVTREELRQRLWPADTFVDFDANLNTSLNRLRQALGDTGNEQMFIKTIPRQGYRFIATVVPREEGYEGPSLLGAAIAPFSPGAPEAPTLANGSGAAATFAAQERGAHTTGEGGGPLEQNANAPALPVIPAQIAAGHGQRSRYVFAM